MHILMVCIGNICRSPIAEGVMRHRVKQYGLDWTIESAGTLSYHIGEPPHILSQMVCTAHGIDISTIRARKFVEDDFNYFGKIYAMSDDVYHQIICMTGEESQIGKVTLLLNELHPGRNESVPDPYFENTEKAFEKVYQMINAACDAIIKKHSKDV